jgi:hypothetical protein
LPLLIELGRAPELIIFALFAFSGSVALLFEESVALLFEESVFALFAFSGSVALLFEESVALLLIGVMVSELLGVIMPAPLLLLPREMEAPDSGEEGELSEFPAAASRGGGTEVLGLRGRWPKRPMPLSAFPPANACLVLFLLQQLHPVNNMPRLHALIRPAKGILPIVSSSPV